MFYNKKIIFRSLLAFALVLLVMKATNGMGFVALFPFVLIAFTHNRPEKFLFYILLMIAMVVTNPILAPRSGVFFMEQRIMFVFIGFCLMVKIAGRRASPIVKPFMLMGAYVFYMTLTSFQGWQPIVSLLKLVLFSVIYFAFYSTANAAALHPRSGIAPIRSVLLALAIPYLLGSIVLIWYPAIGMMSYDEVLRSTMTLVSLFRGFTSHSQCLGPIVACLWTILLADLLFGIRKPDKLYILLLICCPILIWKTSSRTALGSMLAGASFVMFFFMRARNVQQRWRGKVIGAAFGIVMLGSVALVLAGAGDKISRFIAKQGEDVQRADVSVAAVVSSRMGLAEDAMRNFGKKPLFGNGFQVSEDLAYLDTSKWWTLLSAPVEKGVWIPAILEEGGVIGMFIFLLFIGNVFFTLLRYKAYVGASTFFTFIVTNFGEFTLFSMSYTGGFCWALVFAAVVLDSARARHELTQQLMKRQWGMFP